MRVRGMLQISYRPIPDVALRVEATNRDRSEHAELAIRTFELSQALESNWLAADYSAKCRILAAQFLSLRLEDISLCQEMTKPFDALAKGLLVLSNRGDKIRTCDLLVPNQTLYQAELRPGIL
jgi:hypothetical protein